MKLIFTNLIHFLPLEQCHHIPMGMYGSGLLKLAIDGNRYWCNGRDDYQLPPIANLSRPLPYIPIRRWWHCSNGTRSINLVKTSFTDQWCMILGASWFRFRFRFQENSKVWFQFRFWFQQEVHWFHSNSDSSPKTLILVPIPGPNSLILIPIPLPIPVPFEISDSGSDSDSSKKRADSGINSNSGIGIVHHCHKPLWWL